MWKIRDLKKRQGELFKRNYIGIVITCFIAAVVMGSFTNPLKEARTIKDTYFDQLNGTVLLRKITIPICRIRKLSITFRQER